MECSVNASDGGRAAAKERRDQLRGLLNAEPLAAGEVITYRAEPRRGRDNRSFVDATIQFAEPYREDLAEVVSRRSAVTESAIKEDSGVAAN